MFLFSAAHEHVFWIKLDSEPGVIIEDDSDDDKEDPGTKDSDITDKTAVIEGTRQYREAGILKLQWKKQRELEIRSFPSYGLIQCAAWNPFVWIYVSHVVVGFGFVGIVEVVGMGCASAAQGFQRLFCLKSLRIEPPFTSAVQCHAGGRDSPLYDRDRAANR